MIIFYLRMDFLVFVRFACFTVTRSVGRQQVANTRWWIKHQSKSVRLLAWPLTLTLLSVTGAALSFIALFLSSQCFYFLFLYFSLFEWFIGANISTSAPPSLRLPEVLVIKSSSASATFLVSSVLFLHPLFPPAVIALSVFTLWLEVRGGDTNHKG